jgi:N,N'-diacetyllegionaminate synthase
MGSVRLGDRLVDGNNPPYLIAEVGLNHSGDIERALTMISAAAECGVDAVKFQTYRADELVGDPTLMFSYTSQGRTVTEPMLDMFRRYELPTEAWSTLAAACRNAGVEFMSTPQNRSDLDVLLAVGVPAVKVGSDDFTNLPLLRSYAQCKLPLILSCGMADLGEVYAALETIGALDGYPTILLLCTSQYPTPPIDVNVRKLDALGAAFPSIVLGFSDHTQGSLAAVLAVAKGARVFEKHFTLSHDLPGPDHWFSEDPSGLRDWVNAIRTADVMLGSALVRPTSTESAQRGEFRRFIVASRDINVGELLSEDALAMRRISGTGLPAALITQVVGRLAHRAFRKGEPITL